MPEACISELFAPVLTQEPCRGGGEVGGPVAESVAEPVLGGSLPPYQRLEGAGVGDFLRFT